eukprot:scaffold13973_cov43-Cyclotella_meneghiniana.AAC.4
MRQVIDLAINWVAISETYLKQQRGLLLSSNNQPMCCLTVSKEVHSIMRFATVRKRISIGIGSIGSIGIGSIGISSIAIGGIVIGTIAVGIIIAIGTIAISIACIGGIGIVTPIGTAIVTAIVATTMGTAISTAIWR